MNRREFLKSIGTGYITLSLHPLYSLATVTASAFSTERHIPHSAMTLSYEEFNDQELSVVEGILPNDLYGNFLFQHSLAPAGTPFMSGDAMVFRISFSTETLPKIKSTILRTPCWYAEQEVRNTSDEFVNHGVLKSSSSLGFRNMINVGFQTFGEGRILASGDSNRPWELDPVTLNPVTPVGAISEWSSFALALFPAHVPFPATMANTHPGYDPETGEIFFVNYGLIPLFEFTDLIRWDGTGPLKRWKIVNEQGAHLKMKQSVHQVVATRDYIVFMDSSFSVELTKVIGILPEVVKAQLPYTSIYVIRRDDLKTRKNEVIAKSFQIPRESIHFLGDFENPSQRITLYFAHNCAKDFSEWVMPQDVQHHSRTRVRKDVVGSIPSALDVSHVGKFVIDMKAGKIESGGTFWSPELTYGLALYSYNPMSSPSKLTSLYWGSDGFTQETAIDRLWSLYKNYPHRTIPADQLPWKTGKPCALFRLDCQTMKAVDSYLFPQQTCMLSFQFIPRKDGTPSDTNGYIAAIVVSDAKNSLSSTDEIWIFDAAELNLGPLCKLSHSKFDVGLTFHTTWMAEMKPRTSSYQIPVNAELAPRVAHLKPHLRKIFEDKVYPNFNL